MLKHSTIWLLALTLALTLGAGTVLYAQTTNVERDFTFTGDNYIYNVAGLSVGTSATTSGSIHFSDGTTMSSVNDAGAWTSTSTGILYNSGNVGINVSNPNSKLDVNGNIYGSILYDKDNTSYYVNPSGSSVLSGNLGIGTTSASYPLHISGSEAFKISLERDSSAPHILFDDNSTAGTARIWAYNSGFEISQGDDTGSQSGNVWLRGDSSGNIGIGTTTPSGKLDLANGKIVNLGTPSNDSDAATKSYVDDNTGGSPGGSDGNVQFNNSGSFGGSSNLYWDDSNNRLGVGTTTPSRPLHVQDSSHAWMTVDSSSSGNHQGYLMGVNGSWKASVRWYDSDNTLRLGTNAGSSAALNITTGDDVGIGDTSPSAQLVVSGNVRANQLTDKNNTNYYVNPSGNSNFSGVVKFDTDSDRRIYGASRNTNDTVVIDGNWNEAEIMGRVWGATGSNLHIGDGYSSVNHTSGGGNDEIRMGSGYARIRLGTDGTTEHMRIDSSGNVGINDSSPSSQLDVSGNVRANQLTDKNNTSYYVNPSSNSFLSGDLGLGRSPSTKLTVNGSSTAGLVRFENDSAGEETRLRMRSRNPGASDWFHVDLTSYNPSSGNGYFGIKAPYDNTDGSGYDFVVREPGNVGIGTTNPSQLLEVNGDWILGGSAQANLNMNSNDITGVNKITTNTVDPVYSINGEKYATFMAGMTGVKEETTGSARLQCEKKQGPDCKHTIDLEQVKKGSDLWLFYRTSDFGEDWRDLRVIVSPREEAGVWSGGYNLDPVEGQLTFHAEPIEVAKPVSELTPEISYRLTAPRFDSEQWSNRYQGESEGMTVPIK